VSNLQLFATCVAIWGSTWLAIKFQLGRVAPEASVFWRYLIASAMVFAFCHFRRLPLRFSRQEHLWFAILGAFMFCLSYIFVYYAEEHVVSGLVAVGYSASPLLGMLGMRLFFGTPMTRRVTVGSLLGIVGIVLVFGSEFAKLGSDRATLLGATYTAIAVLLSTLGSMVAHRNNSKGMPLWQGMAWGMLYGSIWAALITLATGKSIDFEPTLSYVLSLLYLALLGSVLAFAGYLTLLKRIGAARSGYIGVMVPIVALLVSAAFESFRFHPLLWVGVAISVVGNVVILRQPKAAHA
jgi:drug/metabolite transporter (DMT)-like permease